MQIAYRRAEVAEEGRVLPQAGAQVAPVGGQVAHQGDHQHEGVFGDGFAAVGGHVAHGDTGGSGGGGVDVVAAGGADGDHFELRVGGEVFGGDADFVCGGDVRARQTRGGVFGGGLRVFGEGVREGKTEGVVGGQGSAVEEDDVFSHV